MSSQRSQLNVLSLENALSAVQQCETAYKSESEEPAYLVYTSGTTGYPKGVLHAHRALLGRQPAAQYWFNYDDSLNDRIMHSGKFNWTYVLGTGLMDPLYLGKTVIVHEGKNDAQVWLSLIQKRPSHHFYWCADHLPPNFAKNDSYSSRYPQLAPFYERRRAFVR